MENWWENVIQWNGIQSLKQACGQHIMKAEVIK